jgi:hypothetical protein
MRSTTITMERTTALEKLEQYEQAAKSNPKVFQEMDRSIMQGYRVLARGGRLLDVNEALKAGGLNLAGQPKLAIARANVPLTRFRVSNNGAGFYWWHENRVWSSRYDGDRFSWRVAEKTFDYGGRNSRDVEAMTPLIPLPLRPKHDLSNYFLLWEANWHPAPPVDPYLLRPITGSLMEIIAEWDLTPLEVAAVRGAMRTAD